MPTYARPIRWRYVRKKIHEFSGKASNRLYSPASFLLPASLANALFSTRFQFTIGDISVKSRHWHSFQLCCSAAKVRAATMLDAAKETSYLLPCANSTAMAGNSCYSLVAVANCGPDQAKMASETGMSI
jgi:hypothetical protein